MSITEVSRRYARAFLALTKQKGEQARALAELRGLCELIEKEAPIHAYFESPLISPDQKTSAISAALADKGLLEETASLLKLLAERNRLTELHSIVDALQERIDEEDGLTRGIVRSARPLAPEALRELESKISTTLKKKIVLTLKEDPKLLGGVVAQVGGWTFDDSLETHLKKMNEDLNRSAQ